jgi:NADPH:quinone reductase
VRHAGDSREDARGRHRSLGGPEVLEVREVPVPDIGKDEVLIALEASGVGSWDAEVRGAGGPRASRLPADPGD